MNCLGCGGDGNQGCRIQTSPGSESTGASRIRCFLGRFAAYRSRLSALGLPGYGRLNEAVIFSETELDGAWTVDVEPIGDERGFFARWYCRSEFAERGLDPMDAQGNMSYSASQGTLRGLHLQLPPAAEAKLVRCTKGSIFDVIVDCRRGSSTRWKWLGVELSAENRRALYVPKGFAHGYQTLAADTEVYYLVSEFYTADKEAGLRYCDPDLGIEWPLPAQAVSIKDEAWPLLSEFESDQFGVE